MIGKEQTLTAQFLNAGYNVFGAGKIYHSSVHRPGEWTDYLAGGMQKLTPHPTVPNDGVEVIKFGPLTDDSKLSDESIADYGIKQLATQRCRLRHGSAAQGLRCGGKKGRIPRGRQATGVSSRFTA